MDRMQMYEARDIAKNVIYVDKNQRELDRYKLYVAIQSNSKNKIDLKDVIELPWDNKWINKTEFTYNEKEDEEYGNRANMFADMLNNGKLNFEEINLMNRGKGEDKNIHDN